MNIAAEDICVLSFTNVAANELKKRIDSSDIYAGTIHSLANKILLKADIDTSDIIQNEKFDELLIEAMDVSYDKKPHFKYLIVDEFQDTGKNEYYFLESLEVPNIMVIGDPRQRIYGFANKDFDPIGNCLKSNEWVKYTIKTNYRSPQNIIDFGEQFIDDQDFSYGRYSEPLPKKPKLVDKLPEKPEKPDMIPLKKSRTAKELLELMEDGVPTADILAYEHNLKEENEKITLLNEALKDNYKQEKQAYDLQINMITEEYNEKVCDWEQECKRIKSLEKQKSAYIGKGKIICQDKQISINYIISIIEKTKNYGDWAILCRWNSIVNQVLEILEEDGVPATTFRQSNFKDDTNALLETMQSNKVKVLTYHSSKGLEFNNVGVITNHLTHDAFGKETGRLLYVSATRAKKALYWGLYIPKAIRRYENGKKGGLMF